ncbi:MAG: hypothetical protein HY645_15185 [Acidobacteria bacterium]|nr:hypothetical protein [Acidobacteriota bacterium]
MVTTASYAPIRLGTARPPYAVVSVDSSPVPPDSIPQVSVVGFGAFSVVITPSDEGFIAEDLDHHAYGVGSSQKTALSDWYQALLGSYQVLLENQSVLAPQLAEELRQLALKLQDIGPYGSS